MDLTLSDEQRLLRESADRFVAETFTSEHRKKAVNDPLGYSPDIWKQFAELGWLALPISEAHGGLGGGAIEIGLLMEAFGRGLVSEPFLSTVVIGAALVAECGTEAQQQAILPRVAEGALTLAFAHSERAARFDLAHVDPNESGFDALGKGVEEGKEQPEEAPHHHATKYLSRGLTRSRTDNLVIMRGGSAAVSQNADNAPAGGNRVTSLASHGATGRGVSDTIEGAVALKQEVSHDLSPTEKLEALQQWSKPGSAAAAAPSKAERRAEAKAKGYEGEMCSECGNFTLVRNGTCMKCDTCGSTTGCS